jgi:ParB family chromosome partitioning protein
MNFGKVTEKYAERKENKSLIAEQILQSAEVLGKVTVSIDTVADYTDSYGEQPFSIDEEKVTALSESIEQLGQLEPLIVRESKDEIGHYQLLSGHHRKRAMQTLGLTECEVKIIDVNDWQAYCIVCETNIHHEKPLPSQLATMFARYRKHSDENDETPTVSQLSQMFGVSREQMYRYAALNDLEPEIGKAVDSQLLSSNSIKDLRLLSPKSQRLLASYLDFTGKKLNNKNCNAVISFLSENEETDLTVSDIDDFVIALKEEKKKTAPKNTNYGKIHEMSEDELAQFLFNKLSAIRSVDEVKAFLLEEFDA